MELILDCEALWGWMPHRSPVYTLCSKGGNALFPFLLSESIVSGEAEAPFSCHHRGLA